MVRKRRWCRSRESAICFAVVFALACLSAGRAFGQDEGLTQASTSKEPAIGNGFAARVSRAIRGSLKERQRLTSRLSSLPTYAPQAHLRAGFHSRYASSASDAQWVQVDLGAAMKIDSIALVPTYVRRDDRYVEGYGFPRQFRIDVSNDFDFTTKTTVFDSNETESISTGSYPLLISDIGVNGRYVRITCTQLASDGEQWFFALGELLVLSGNRNVAQWRPLASSGTVEADLRWSLTYLVDAISALPTHTTTAVSPTNGFLSAPHDESNVDAWLEIDLGAVYPVDEVRLFPARPQDQPDIPGWGFPLRFKIELRKDVEDMSPVTVFDCSRYDLRHWLHNTLIVPVASRQYFNPGSTDLGATDPPLEMPVDPIETRYVRLNVNRLDSRTAPRYLAMAEIQVYAGSENVAAGKTITASDRALHSGELWDLVYINDGFTSRRELIELPEWLALIEERRKLETRLDVVENELKAATEQVWFWTRWISMSLLVVAVACVAGINVRMRWRHRTQTRKLRSQIASDLHDDIGSNLGTISLLCETLLNEPLREDQVDRLTEIREIAGETSEAMRDIVWIMQPQSIRLEDFVGRVRRTARRLLPDHEIDFDISATLPRSDVSLNWRRNVFLSLKELIHNIAKHAGSTNVQFKVHVVKRRFQVTISDDGAGFDQNIESDGLGLGSVTDRLRRLGGSMNLTTEPSRGTTIAIEAPLS